MTRKKFIQSHNATCKNWNWSWSFVNHESKFIIFGAWDENTKGNNAMIFSRLWSLNKSRKPPAYDECVEHLRLIEEEGYKLKTFVIIKGDYKDENGNFKTKIKTFDKKLVNKKLERIGEKYFAIGDFNVLTDFEEEQDKKEHREGAQKKITVNSYERSSKARKACLSHHGYRCHICEIDFGETYGALAKGFIHVHHRVGLAEIGEEYNVDPIKDLVPVCPNCHSVIHMTKTGLAVDDVKVLLSKNK